MLNNLSVTQLMEETKRCDDVLKLNLDSGDTISNILEWHVLNEVLIERNSQLILRSHLIKVQD